MRRYVFRLTFLALAALGTSVVLGNDQQIAKTIVEKLSAEKKSGNLKGFNIELNVDKGEVWLSGRVSSEDQCTRALEIARRVPGVKQVVNDLSVEEGTGVKQALSHGEGPRARQAVAEVGTGVAPTATPAPAQLQSVPLPAAPAPVPMPAPVHVASAQPFPQQFGAMPGPQGIPYVYGRSMNQVPLAYGPARTIAYNGGIGGGAMAAGPGIAGPGPIEAGGPVPMAAPGAAVGMAAARYDHPYMPGYAWPSYASYPNYAAVTYPKQYSPTAWPYIGPFYPYPQVPLGWRRVCLEWDDGWWFLDFTSRRH